MKVRIGLNTAEYFQLKGLADKMIIGQCGIQMTYLN